MHHRRSAQRHDVLFVLLAMGELARLVALALAGAARLDAAGERPAAAGAWLLVTLAPHAVIASAFLSMLRSAHTASLASRLLVPAKLIGALAAASAAGIELARAVPTEVSLAALPVPLPQWAILAGVASWDLAVMTTLAFLRFSAGNHEAPPPTDAAPPDPERPVYRESEVEELDEAAPDEPER